MFEVGYIASFLWANRTQETLPKAVVGYESAANDKALEEKLCSVLAENGIAVCRVGLSNCGSLCYFVKELSADYGLLIPADCGVDCKKIRIFDATEKELQLCATVLPDCKKHLKAKDTLIDNTVGRYAQYVASLLPSNCLKGIVVCLQHSKKAAVMFMRDIFLHLGAEVLSIDAKANVLRELVIKNKAEIGIAIDEASAKTVIIDKSGNFILNKITDSFPKNLSAVLNILIEYSLV